MPISLRSVYLYIQAQQGLVKVPNNKRVPTYFAEKLVARGQDDAARTALLGLAEQGLVRWSKQLVTTLRNVDPTTLSDAIIFGPDAEPPVVIIDTSGEISTQPAGDVMQQPRHRQSPAPPAPAQGGGDALPEPATAATAPLATPSTARRPGAPARPTSPRRHGDQGVHSGERKPAYSTVTSAKATNGTALDPTRLTFEVEHQVAKNQELATTNRRLRKELSDNRTALAERDEVEAGLRERIAELERNVADRDVAATQAATAYDELVSTHHAQAFELKEAQRQLAAAADTIARLEVKIAQLTEELARNSVRTVNERLGAQIGQLKSDKEELYRTITTLLTELKETRHRIGELTEDLQAECTINRNLTDELGHAEDALRRLTTGETGQHHLACGHLVIISFDPDHQLDAGHPDCKSVRLREVDDDTDSPIFRPVTYRPQPDAPRHERRGQTARKKPRRR